MVDIMVIQSNNKTAMPEDLFTEHQEQWSSKRCEACVPVELESDMQALISTCRQQQKALL